MRATARERARPRGGVSFEVNLFQLNRPRKARGRLPFHFTPSSATCLHSQYILGVAITSNRVPRLSYLQRRRSQPPQRAPGSIAGRAPRSSRSASRCADQLAPAPLGAGRPPPAAFPPRPPPHPWCRRHRGAPSSSPTAASLPVRACPPSPAGQDAAIRAGPLPRGRRAPPRAAAAARRGGGRPMRPIRAAG